ncbi:MAG: hypothetical protein QNJ40_19405 [Xanthomonadales bacterium]|nr:hypothetical protein [Xanthomonadales bacterium]
MAELICAGRFETLDLSPLSFRRIVTGTPIEESVVIQVNAMQFKKGPGLL